MSRLQLGNSAQKGGHRVNRVRVFPTYSLIQLFSVCLCSLLKCLFPLLPRATSSTLRSYIRKNILTDIRTANLKRKNHKLNRAVQAILFRMVEQDMLAEHLPTSSKGKQGVKATNSTSEDAMWAIFLTKDLWAKGVW